MPIDEDSHTTVKLSKLDNQVVSLMNGINLLSVVLDVNGKIIFVNDYLLGITGYLREEIIGEDWFSIFVPPNLISEIKRVFEGVMGGDGLLAHYENEILTKKGFMLNISWNNALLQSENKEIIGIVGVGEDITGKKRTLAELKSATERLEALINLSPLAILLFESDGKLHLWNKKAEQIFGWKAEEVLGKPPLIIPPDKKPEQMAWLDQILHGVPLVDKETVRQRKDGSLVDVSISSAVIKTGSGEMVGQMIIITDITDRKNAEREVQAKQEEIESQNEEYLQLNEELNQINAELLEAKEKAIESYRLKTAFLQNMSHEIRTPMNAIMGFSKLLEDSFDDKVKLKRFSDIIRSRCSDLLDIINDILDIAKIESGQLPVHLEECSLTLLFEELYSFFIEYKNRLEKHHLELVLHPPCASSDIMLLTDKVKLKQIFINLIGNAFKFTDEGKIEYGCKSSESGLLFFVSDTGIGIPSDKQELIFERFAQLQQDQKKSIVGTGLGLPIVKGLVELLEGRIWLDSRSGIGSTFYFTIKGELLHKIDDIVERSEKIPSAKLRNAAILIVEDDMHSADYLKEILSGENVTTYRVKCGEEALVFLDNKSVDLVLLDFRLPDMNGYDITRKIKVLYPKTKLVIQSAYASAEDNRKAFEAGADDFVSKPINEGLLLLKIGRLLRTKF